MQSPYDAVHFAHHILPPRDCPNVQVNSTQHPMKTGRVPRNMVICQIRADSLRATRKQYPSGGVR